MEYTAQMIAQLIGGTVEGNPDAKVYTFAKIEEGTPGCLSFLANPKYIPYIYTTKSSIVLVSNDFVAEKPVSATLIRVADPYETVSELMEAVANLNADHPTGVEDPAYVADGVELSGDVYVGAFAYIGKNAKIGKNVKIYPQVYIGKNVVIGDDTVIYPGVKIYADCHVGKRCIIHSGVVIGADGFGFAPKADGSYHKIPQMGNVEIEDDVEIGANTTVDRATMGSTKILHGTKIDNLIQIAHNVVIGHDTVMAAQSGVAGSTKIGNNCMIAGQVGFAGHITVGDNVTIGAQSGIPNNVSSGSRLMGYPAVNAGQFARQTAMLRRLASLFDRVENLERRSENPNNFLP